MGAGAEAVLEAEDEPFHEGQYGGSVVREVKEVVVEVVAESAAVEGCGGGLEGEGGGGCRPDDGAGGVGHPPDAGVFVGGPQGGGPGGEDGGERV